MKPKITDFERGMVEGTKDTVAELENFIADLKEQIRYIENYELEKECGDEAKT